MLWLFVLGALARRVIDLERRSLDEHRASMDEPGYYLVQFRSPITTPLLRRLEAVLGYEPRDYVPSNALLLWIDSRERGEALLRATPHIYSIDTLASEYRRIDFSAAINTFRVKYERQFAVHANTTRDTALIDAFDRDAGGSLMLRLRVLARNLTNDELQRLAQPVCRTQITMAERSGYTHLLENVHCDDGERVAAALSAHPAVQWVELRTPHHTMNRWSVGSLQRAAGADQQSTTFALRGAGQLLSMSDTGVAAEHCAFADTAPLPTTSIQRVPADTKHRKVRAYWSGSGGDFRDAGPNSGHGTHVAGTALGSSSTLRSFNGGAPDARLVFIDLLPESSGTPFLEVPLDIDRTLMEWSHAVGARVHSASWGSDSGGRYTSDEQALDRFTYENRFFLPVFAAGNEGPTSPSISSPSLAKNVLSVGATMNGIDALRLAQQPTRPADDYSPDWLAPFSSRGAVSLAFRKPDVVAPGGSYVWSAAAGTQCGTAGLQGTSMATPLVAAGAVLVREYFIANRYPNRAAIGGITTPLIPTASLVRAMLVASAVPLRGVYPRQSFRSVQERIDAGGHGRVALDRVLDTGGPVTLAVLSNEETPLAVQRARRWCIEVVGEYEQLVVTMAYADYPSMPMARAALVNDLRLTVADERGAEYAINEQPASEERRSTIERAVVAGSQRIAVAVHADEIGFGDTQTFSLIVVVHGASASLRISGSSTAPCVVCELRQQSYVPANECAVCGDGKVDPTYEQCDSVACCDTTTCRWLGDESPCAIIAGDCRLAGTCRQAGCEVNTDLAYGIVDGPCRPVDTPPTRCLFSSSSTWAARIASIDDERQLCCAPLRAAFEHIEFEHLFATLAHEYAAARLNLAQPGTVADAGMLLALERASALLERRCGVGFTDIGERLEASMLYNELRALNEQCGDKTIVDAENRCSADALDTRLCSGGGVYDRTTGVCLCHSNRHPAEPDCAHLGCSGTGVSLYDYERRTERCVCLDGWSGPDCSQCATSVGPLVYHCVGAPLALASAGQRHYLQPVARDTVSARLSGAYYAQSIEKHADAVPGRDDYDCWCRTPDERIDWRAASSHRDSVLAALQQRAAMTVLAALSETIYADTQPCTTNGPPPAETATAVAALLGVLMVGACYTIN